METIMSLDEEIREEIARIPSPPLIMDDWEEIADSLSCKFDWKGSKIDWAKTRDHKGQSLPGDYDDWVLAVTEFIKNASIQDVILGGDIYYINDSSLDFA